MSPFLTYICSLIRILKVVTMNNSLAFRIMFFGKGEQLYFRICVLMVTKISDYLITNLFVIVFECGNKVVSRITYANSNENNVLKSIIMHTYHQVQFKLTYIYSRQKKTLKFCTLSVTCFNIP